MLHVTLKKTYQVSSSYATGVITLLNLPAKAKVNLAALVIIGGLG